MDQARRQHEECALTTIARMKRYLQLAEDAIRGGAPSITHARTLAQGCQRLTEDTQAMTSIDLHLAKAAVA